ncbi:Holliday junction branch migration protein RuvA [Patescibacteria group bacterium]|nr:MAG: Holliday junction branch migration protein RuvA [Patescibacteria group bacterium]
MIALLKGVVAHRGNGFLIVEIAGVGYRVTMPEAAMNGLSGEVTLFTHEAQRDDGRELFGFRTADELELFSRLICVSGVGPKSGQKIACVAPVDEVKKRIMTQDIAFLSSVQGIGKKTAQKIVLELSGVLAEEGAEVAEGAEESVDALVGLGYSRKQAADALDGLEGDTEGKIRQALKRLSR